MRKKPSETVIKRLFALSGNLCVFPECKHRLVKDETLLGEICHIEAANPKGARYNPTQTDDERVSFENLMLLCGIHHKIVDSGADTYTVEKLKRMKQDHETKNKQNPYDVDDALVRKALGNYSLTQENIYIGNGQQITTQTGDIVITSGLMYTEAKDLFQKLFDRNFPKLRKIAQKTAQKNVESLAKTFFEKAKTELAQRDINKLSDPDLQFILNQAITVSARINSEELRKNLASLIIKRIKNDEEDLKRIVFNEAIATIGKLTTNQLKILTLCFLVRYTNYGGVANWQTFNHYLNGVIKPFIDFRDTDAEFQHLEYTSCASISIGSVDIINIFKESYSFLFLDSIKKENVDEIKIQSDLIPQILFFNEKENEHKFRFINKKVLTEYLQKQNVPEEVKAKIVNLYQNSIKSNSEIEKQIREETDMGNDLLNKWKTTRIKNMSLTSVGIAIASTYLEQVTNQVINIDIWIH